MIASTQSMIESTFIYSGLKSNVSVWESSGNSLNFFKKRLITTFFFNSISSSCCDVIQMKVWNTLVLESIFPPVTWLHRSSSPTHSVNHIKTSIYQPNYNCSNCNRISSVGDKLDSASCNAKASNSFFDFLPLFFGILTVSVSFFSLSFGLGRLPLLRGNDIYVIRI